MRGVVGIKAPGGAQGEFGVPGGAENSIYIEGESISPGGRVAAMNPSDL